MGKQIENVIRFLAKIISETVDYEYISRDDCFKLYNILDDNFSDFEEDEND